MLYNFKISSKHNNDQKIFLTVSLLVFLCHLLAIILMHLAWNTSPKIRIIKPLEVVSISENIISDQIGQKAEELQNPKVPKNPVQEKKINPIKKPTHQIKEQPKPIIKQNNILKNTSKETKADMVSAQPPPSALPSTNTTTQNQIESTQPSKNKNEGSSNFSSEKGGYINSPKPIYPAASIELKEQGTVIIEVTVSASGSIKSAHIKKGSGKNRLDKAALETVRKKYKFRPDKKNGQPIESIYTVPIRFELN